MLELHSPSEGLLFFSFLYRSDLFQESILIKKVESLYGETFQLSPATNPLKSYYAKEMGDETHLNRVFLLTSKSYPREFLLTSKLQALEWEKGWCEGVNRMVNVDTGFLALENFLLATTKNYSHRVYLGQNIFADLTYQFADGCFQQLPWTYPDYRDDEKLEFFTWGRSFLLQGKSS